MDLPRVTPELLTAFRQSDFAFETFFALEALCRTAGVSLDTWASMWRTVERIGPMIWVRGSKSSTPATLARATFKTHMEDMPRLRGTL